jgi:hypothetical protein
LADGASAINAESCCAKSGASLRSRITAFRSRACTSWGRPANASLAKWTRLSPRIDIKSITKPISLNLRDIYIYNKWTYGACKRPSCPSPMR